MGSGSPNVESKKRLGIPLDAGSLGSTHLAVFPTVPRELGVGKSRGELQQEHYVLPGGQPGS